MTSGKDEPSSSPFILPVPWGILHVGAVIAASFVAIFTIQIILVIAMAVFGQLQGVTSSDLTPFLEQKFGSSPWHEILLTLQILVELFFIKKIVLDRFPLPDNLFFPAGQWKWDLRCALRFFGWVFVGIVAVGMMLVLLIGIVALLAGQNPEFAREAWRQGAEEESQKFLTPISGSWLSILLAVTIVPVIEEILFRGLLYGALKKHCSIWVSNLASSFVFAMVHGYFYGFYIVFLLGIISAYAYEKTRSLRTAMIVHCFWNLWVFSCTRSFAAVSLALMLSCWLISHREQNPFERETVRSPRVFWQGLFWKLYAPMFQVLMVGGCLSHVAAGLWMILFETPAYLAVYLYAFHRRWFTPRIWRFYGGAYLIYFALDLIENFQEYAGQTDQLIGSLLFCLALYGPSLWALWRMSFPRPENS